MDNETIADVKEWFKHFLERKISVKDSRGQPKTGALKQAIQK